MKEITSHKQLRELLESNNFKLDEDFYISEDEDGNSELWVSEGTHDWILFNCDCSYEAGRQLYFLSLSL
jgi:hypothetical protein